MIRNATFLVLALLSVPVLAQESDGPEATRQSPAWMPAPEPAVLNANANGNANANVNADGHDRGGRRWGVFSAGFSLWAVSYAADVGVTYGLGHSNPGLSLIPIVGPLVQLHDSYSIADPKMAQGNATIGQMISDGNHAYQSAIYAGLAIDAAVQLAGVITAIAGAASHTRRPASLVASSGRGLSVSF